MSPEARIRARARELGFEACGITHPGPSAHAEHLDRWLARGYGGTMRYLHRQAKKRKDPSLIVPGARSVIVVLDNYYDPDEPADLQPPRVARYARGEDYHQATGRRLDLLAAELRELGATVTRSFTDAGPVPERELAQRAGLGWAGKNTMLISPKLGSFCFIGSVFSDLALAVDTPFQTDHCGTCTRCLDSCPTDALVAPRELDATRCISYLTIEQKGAIPDDLAPRLEGWAFGCDICNDVCPWNLRFARPADRAPLPAQARLDATTDALDTMDEAGFRERFGATPFVRAGLAGMRRNVRAALRSVSATAAADPRAADSPVE